MAQEDAVQHENEVDRLQQEVAQIVQSAKSDQDGAVTQAWLLIEGRLRNIMAETNWGEANFIDVMQPIQRLVDLGVIAKNTTGNIQLIAGQIGRIARHEAGNSGYVAINAALLLIRALSAVQFPVFIVDRINVELYSDIDCQSICPGIKGVILTGSFEDGLDDDLVHRQIVPVTRTDFVVGKYVSCSFNSQNVFGETFYVDPESKQKQLAWSSSGEFIGFCFDKMW